MRAGADVKAYNLESHTSLHPAAGRGHAQVAKALIEAAADLEARSSCTGFTPLLLSSHNGHVEAMDALIEARVKTDPYMPHEGTPLYAAAVKKHAGAKADASFVDAEGPTARGRPVGHCSVSWAHGGCTRVTETAGDRRMWQGKRRGAGSACRRVGVACRHHGRVDRGWSRYGHCPVHAVRTGNEAQ